MRLGPSFDRAACSLRQRGPQNRDFPGPGLGAPGPTLKNHWPAGVPGHHESSNITKITKSSLAGVRPGSGSRQWHRKVTYLVATPLAISQTFRFYNAPGRVVSKKQADAANACSTAMDNLVLDRYDGCEHTHNTVL